MDHGLRTSIRKSFAVTLTVAALGAGYLAHGFIDGGSGKPASAPARHAQKQYSAAELLRMAATAEAGIYLQFDDVTGPPAIGHTAHAQVTSAQIGVSRATAITGGGRNVGRVSVSDLTITKQTDKYSVPLVNQAIRGEGNGSAILYFTKLNDAGKGVNYIELDLSNVLISSYSLGAGGSETPSESYSLNFTAITMKTQIGAAQQVSYDLITES
jgi:type VI secretion system secreted protein Hcp